MNKELENRMLAKNERNRIHRKHLRAFRKKNPNWEGNTQRSIEVAATRRHVDNTRFTGVFATRKPKPSIFNQAVARVRSIFSRKKI